jgi:hypothetical protein
VDDNIIMVVCEVCGAEHPVEKGFFFSCRKKADGHNPTIGHYILVYPDGRAEQTENRDDLGTFMELMAKQKSFRK